MADREQEKAQLQNVSRLKISLIIGYGLIVIAAVLFVCILAVRKTDSVLKNKVSSMVSSLNVQMRLNMDSYLSRMETIGTLAFAAEESYAYDATNPDNDEYEALNTEKIISDKLYSLCIMENFVDYGIVYRNNHTVGKISNGTVNLFGEKLFSDLSKVISSPRTKDGWCAGYHNDFKRIYYVKQIHENALLLISFYATELESVFDNPETVNGMEIRLTNQDYDILYSSSSEQDKIGLKLNHDIVERIWGLTSATVMDNEYVVSVNACGDDWYVVCSIPTQVILSEKNEMQLYIYLAALIAALLAVSMGAVLSVKLAEPVTDIVTELDSKAHVDLLTGILNKLSFEEYTEARLSSSLATERHTLILIDVDNFKGVNDTLGHTYGDRVLAAVGSMMHTVFPEQDYLGRVGGDEFAVFLNTASPEMPYEEYVRSKCEAICESFRNHYTGDDRTYKISASIGAALSPEHGRTFKELYANADKALYASKHRGKDTYTIFDHSEQEESS